MENASDEENEETCTRSSFDFTKKTWRDDVTFLVEDQRLFATKAILAIASPVFEAMFGTNFRERDDEEVPLPGKSFDDFTEFLHCVYEKSARKISEENVYKVLPLADEYNVNFLMKDCKRFLSTHLINDQPSTRQVVLCHGLATRHNFHSLREVCARRLSDVGIRDIESAGIVFNDTETLLEMHKDILRNKDETLEEIRTELVELYLKKDLTVNEGSAPPRASETKGAIIKFQPMIEAMTEGERKISNSVTLWDIDFKLVIKKIKRDDEDYISVLLSSTFPQNSEQTSCKINAKFQMKNSGREFRSHYCFTMKDKVFTGKLHGFKMKVAHLIGDGFLVDGKLDILIYFLVNKSES